MSPRPYQLGRRQAHVDESRRRVLDAARALLADATAYSGFTVEAVARRADVARATVYYQFGPKTGLLEAVCDDLAEEGRLADLGEVFTTADPLEALRGYIAAFGRFWAADRPVMRRLRALAALDPDVQVVIAARNERMLEGLTVLTARLAGHRAIAPGLDKDEAVRVLAAVLSFETFDRLAGQDRELSDVVPLITSLAEAALGITADRRPR